MKFGKWDFTEEEIAEQLKESARLGELEDMEIREKIKALPEGVSIANDSGEYDYTRDYLHLCDSTELKALLDRLEKLEGAARDAVHMLDDDCPVAAQATLREALK